MQALSVVSAAARGMTGALALRNVEGHAGRCVGSLLGCMAGDILGSSVEGKSAEEIEAWFPGGKRSFSRTHGRPDPFGTDPDRCGYTDDTEMALALTSSLVEEFGVSPAAASAKYAEYFRPERGYGNTAVRVLGGLREGTADWRTSGTDLLPGGSWANGGAMRIAPVGLAYRHAPLSVLERAVRDALVCTHVHPVGVDGAVVQAAAVSWCARHQPPGGGEAGDGPLDLLGHLHRVAATDEMRGKLRVLESALGAGLAAGGGERAVAAEVAEPFQIRATEAVACALLALCAHWGDPEEAIVAAVGYGGDTDTVAAMAGAMAGALHGSSWLPDEWWARMEGPPRGRDHAVELGGKLALLDLVE